MISAQVEEHTTNYGTGMMIAHWRVHISTSFYDMLFSTGAPLADRLAAEAKQFRKPENVRAARGDLTDLEEAFASCVC